MSNLDKDVLDALCVQDPLWSGALQLVLQAKRLCGDDPVKMSAQLVCAIVLLASDHPDPRATLKLCAESLLATPMGED